MVLMLMGWVLCGLGWVVRAGGEYTHTDRGLVELRAQLTATGGDPRRRPAATTGHRAAPAPWPGPRTAPRGRSPAPPTARPLARSTRTPSTGTAPGECRCGDA